MEYICGLAGVYWIGLFETRLSEYGGRIYCVIENRVIDITILYTCLVFCKQAFAAKMAPLS